MAAFLKNLFTPKWQHKNAEVRLVALQSITDQKVLLSLAVNDSNVDVRIKAIALIQDSTDLNELLNNKEAPIKQAATNQYLLVTLGSSEPQQQIAKIAQIKDTKLLMSIATMMGNNELAQAALANIDDEQQLFAFIKQSASTKARQLAMEKIQQPQLLKDIEKQFKNKDKTLTRQAKNKLSQLQKIEAESQKSIAHTQQLLKNAQLLAQATFKPTYLAELTHSKQAWLNVESSTEQQKEFASAIEVCEKTLFENQQQQAELLTQQKNTQDAQTLHKETNEQLNVLFEQCKSGSIPTEDELTQLLNETQGSWQKASLLHKADAITQKEYTALLTPLKNLLASLNTLNHLKATEQKDTSDFQQHLKQLKACESQIKKVSWPQDFPHSKKLHELQAQLSNKLAAVDVHKKNEKQTLDTIKTLVNQLEQDINEGQLKNGKQHESKIRKLFKQLPTQHDKSLNNQFIHLSNQLNELKDWQGYAAAPKFENLCVEMENLITAKIDAKQLSLMIQNLQDQWKSLGGLPDKQQHQALWTRFKKASDKAYEPCKQFYQDLNKVKQYNQEQKLEICNQLEIFFEKNDWPNADWKAIQSLLDHANSEFKKFSPVENSVHKSLQQRFHVASKNIHSKIMDFYQANAQQKQELIDKTKALLIHPELATAIEECKKIQQQWRAIDPAGRQEHSLWKTFREQCDAIFNRRNAENEAHKQQQNEEKEKAAELIKQATALADQKTNDGLQQLKSIKESLFELDLPAGFQEQKSNQLTKIEDHIKQQLKQQKNQAKQQLWLDAMSLSSQLANWELNQQGELAELETQIKDALLPETAEDIFLSRVQGNTANTNDDYLKLCLELEITQDVTSPAGDQNARMALQVNRLQKNMGKKQPEQLEQLKMLQLEWFALRACTQQYSEFNTRFQNALNKEG